MGVPGPDSGAWESEEPIPASQACDPELDMKWILIFVVALVFLGSLIADYKWRKWMADRKRDRQ